MLVNPELVSFKPLILQLQNLDLSVPHHDFNKILKLRMSDNLPDVLEYLVQLENLAKFKLDELYFTWNIEGSALSVNHIEFERMCTLIKAAELLGEYDVNVLKKALALANEANNINIIKKYQFDNPFTSRFLFYIKGKLHSLALEKLIQQNKSFSLSCKIAQQAAIYFKKSGNTELYAYNQALAYFYSSKDLQSQTKYGLQIKRLEDCITCLKSFWINSQEFTELYNSVEESLKSAKQDNDMIYLQIVPEEIAGIVPEDVISSELNTDFLPQVDPLFSTVLPFDILEHLKLYKDMKKEQIDPRKYHLDNLLQRSKSILELNLLQGSDYQIFQKFKSSNYEDQLQQMMTQLTIKDVQDTLEKVKTLRNQLSDAVNKKFEPLVNIMKKGEEIINKMDAVDNEKGLVSILVKTKATNRNLTDAMDKFFKDNWLPILEGLEEFVVGFEHSVTTAESSICAVKEDIAMNLLKAQQIEEEVDNLWKVIFTHLESRRAKN
eukprot:NODE_4_length_77007_cov_1.156642.p14 type:complete len:493 gc:universal NODE_4_length_77007_cov_1.156642:51876-50398(-)